VEPEPVAHEPEIAAAVEPEPVAIEPEIAAAVEPEPPAASPEFEPFNLERIPVALPIERPDLAPTPDVRPADPEPVLVAAGPSAEEVPASSEPERGRRRSRAFLLLTREVALFTVGMGILGLIEVLSPSETPGGATTPDRQPPAVSVPASQ